MIRSYKVPITATSLIRHIHEGWQLGIGNRSDDYYQHIYFKTKDKGGELALDPKDYRARIEITLQGAALPLQPLDAWEGFRFESLTDWFRFRKMKDDLTPTEKQYADRMVQIGEKAIRNRAGGGTRLHGKMTRADVLLNDRAKGALRRLSDWWEKAPLAEIRDEKNKNAQQPQGND